MQLNKLTRLMAGAVIMFAITVAASIAAQAQYPGGYGNDVYRMAEEQGYRDGYAHGADHARQGRRYDYAGTSHYRDATNGYRSGYGNKDAYKQTYRNGFVRGYEAGYRSTGAYNAPSNRNNPYYGNDPYYRNGPYYGNSSPYYRNDPYYGSGGYSRRGGFGRHGGLRIVIPFRRHR